MYRIYHGLSASCPGLSPHSLCLIQLTHYWQHQNVNENRLACEAHLPPHSSPRSFPSFKLERFCSGRSERGQREPKFVELDGHQLPVAIRTFSAYDRRQRRAVALVVEEVLLLAFQDVDAVRLPLVTGGVGLCGNEISLSPLAERRGKRLVASSGRRWRSCTLARWAMQNCCNGCHHLLIVSRDTSKRGMRNDDSHREK